MYSNDIIPNGCSEVNRERTEKELISIGKVRFTLSLKVEFGLKYKKFKNSTFAAGYAVATLAYPAGPIFFIVV